MSASRQCSADCQIDDSDEPSPVPRRLHAILRFSAETVIADKAVRERRREQSKIKERVKNRERSSARYKALRDNPEFRRKNAESVRKHQKRYPIAARARRLVNWHVKKGNIPKATDFDCVDCGKPATDYEHRDYRKPLEIEPTCRSCNLLRGPAAPYA